MPRQARVVVPGLPHHIIQRGNRRQGKIGKVPGTKGQEFFDSRVFVGLLDWGVLVITPTAARDYQAAVRVWV